MVGKWALRYRLSRGRLRGFLAVGLLVLVATRDGFGDGDRRRGAGEVADVAIVEGGFEPYEEPAATAAATAASALQSAGIAADYARLSTLLGGCASALKIAVQKEGIYRVAGHAILAADPRWRGAKLQDLRLLCQGEPVPLWLEDRDSDGLLDSDDAVEFWGEPYRPDPRSTSPDRYWDPYTRTNVYWLTQAPSLPPRWLVPLHAGVSSMALPEATWAPQQIHIEEDRLFDRLGRVSYPSDRDHWFWGAVHGQRLEQFPFELPVPDTVGCAKMELTVCLSGKSCDGLGQHSVQILLGGRQIGAPLRWRDQEYVITTFGPAEGLHPSLLHPGTNVLAVLNLSPDEADQVLFNWAELVFPQQFRAVDGLVKFRSPPATIGRRVRFRVRGFTLPEVEVFRLGVGKLEGYRVERAADEPTWDVVFEDWVDEAGTYVALEPRRKCTPVRIWPVEPSYWSALESAGFDYVVIGPDSFLHSPAVEELVALREAGGLQAVRVPVEHIYDVFAWGITTPEAIRCFLLHALKSWPRKPRYLLLLGAGSLTRETFGSGSCLLPSIWSQTVKYGAAPCDNRFVVRSLLDPIPEVAVGRLPVRSVGELETVVAKICAYERAPPGPWLNRVLAIAGVGSTFRGQLTELLGHHLDWGYQLRRIDAGPPPSEFSGSTQDLLDQWNRGLAMIHFLGHGGGRIWSDDLLMTFDAVSGLTNGSLLPFVASWTCFTAAFDGSESLGMRLLLQPDGGAVAVLGATGVGWVWNDYYLLRELLRLLEQDGVETIGDAVRLAKREYYLRYPSALGRSQLNQYTLLGDPATPLRLAREGLRLEAKWLGGDPPVIEIGPLEGVSGASVEGFHPRSPARSMELAHEFRDGRIWVQLPSNGSPGDSLLLRVTAWGDRGQAVWHAVVRPALPGAKIDSIWWEPPHPTAGEEIWLCACGNLPASAELSLSCPETGFTTTFFRQPDGCFRSARALVVSDPGLVDLELVARDPDGRPLASKRIELPVASRGGYALAWESVEWEARGSHMNLCLTVSAGSWVRGERCVVRVFVAPTDAGPWREVGADTVEVAPGGTARASLPWRGSFEPVWIRVECAGIGTEPIASIERRLDPQVFGILPDGRFLGVAEEAKELRLGPFALRTTDAPGETVLVTYALLPADSLRSGQPGFVPHGEASPCGLRIASLSAHAIALRVGWPALDAGGQVRCCLLNGKDQWAVADARGELVLRLPGKGRTTVGLFRVEDGTPPAVSFLAGGREFGLGDFVSEGDVLIRAYDASGIDGRPGSVSLLLDGDELDAQACLEPVSQHRDALIWRFRRNLAAGEHELAVRVRDNAGNWTESTARFRIAETAKLVFLGNYPNPFREHTVVTYELTVRAERLSIDVHTASGRRIRRLADGRAEDPDLLAPGYHEVIWDGKDERQEPVAAGVYFVRIAALLRGRWHEYVAKVARIP